MLLQNRIISVIVMFFILSIGLTFGKSNSDSKSYENFALYDINSNLHSLKDFTNKKSIVIIFVSTQCPVSNAYNSRMESLYHKYKDEFSFVGINSNKQENISEIKKHAVDNSLDFVILKDSSNIVADKFEATVTPEVYILDNSYNLLYHGRIDDSRRKDNIEVHDLSNALEEIKSGKEVTVKRTKAFGCSIKRVGK